MARYWYRRVTKHNSNTAACHRLTSQVSWKILQACLFQERHICTVAFSYSHLLRTTFNEYTFYVLVEIREKRDGPLLSSLTSYFLALKQGSTALYLSLKIWDRPSPILNQLLWSFKVFMSNFRASRKSRRRPFHYSTNLSFNKAMSLLLTTNPNRSTVSLGKKLRFKNEDEEKFHSSKSKTRWALHSLAKFCFHNFLGWVSR